MGKYDMSDNSIAKLDISKFDTSALAYVDLIYRFAFHMVQDEEKAQNLALYTYLKACKSLNGYSDKTICKTRLLAILNDAIMKASPVIPEARERKSVSGVAVKRLSEIANAMSELPAMDRAVVLLSDMEGLSYREIANIVGCSVRNVSFRLCRSRRLLVGKLKASLNCSR